MRFVVNRKALTQVSTLTLRLASFSATPPMPHTHSLICHRPYMILATDNVAPLYSAEEII